MHYLDVLVKKEREARDLFVRPAASQPKKKMERPPKIALKSVVKTCQLYLPPLCTCHWRCDQR